MAQQEHAARLAQEGFSIQGYLYLTEAWDNKWELVQCFNCQGYGHISKSCLKEQVCALCSKGHRTKECQKEAQNHRCINCGAKHPTFSRLCSRRRAIKEKLAFAKAKGAEYLQRLWQQQQQQQPQVVWGLADSNKKRKLPGRPIGSTSKAKTIPRKENQPTIEDIRAMKEFREILEEIDSEIEIGFSSS